MTGYGNTSTYRETEILSSSPARLVPLLYEQLLVSLRRGILQIRKGDIEGKFDSLARAADIIGELLAALDFDAGAELAGRLASLYGFWATEISTAGRELNEHRLERVAEMVASLSEAWREASRIVEAGESPNKIREAPA